MGIEGLCFVQYAAVLRVRQFVALVIGLVVGVVGATLFVRSLPPEEGSPEEQAAQLELDLKKARKRILELEVLSGEQGTEISPGRTTMDRARSIAQRLRDGERVTVDEFFHAWKPMFRDLSPIFDRIRVRDQKRHFDTVAGELTRKYDLTDGQESKLKGWLDRKAEENAKRFSDIMTSESSRLIDMVRAAQDEHPSDGLDDFMDQLLQGEALDQYRTDRMEEKVRNVQEEADRKVTRLDEIVDLDEGQKDQIFAIMARGARDFDPGMQFDGLGDDTAQLLPGQSRDEAILEVLRPEQQTVYGNNLIDRRIEAEKELSELGLSLPDDWDYYEEDLF